ncbi:unnamed protein product [Phytophthora lilii]|uniref:Unnamed protein product n=1 Tax=Phytophthora lilii TaxID=2077276 RepID=A0A9W6TRR0_9STRA|nr:unnamed protein product [Phytophthora lilii]
MMQIAKTLVVVIALCVALVSAENDEYGQIDAPPYDTGYVTPRDYPTTAPEPTLFPDHPTPDQDDPNMSVPVLCEENDKRPECSS